MLNFGFLTQAPDLLGMTQYCSLSRFGGCKAKLEEFPEPSQLHRLAAFD